jgi:DNA-binding transcriptional LysR family regulator
MSAVNLRDFDLKLLVAFEAIYTAGNITRAAEKLALSQPTVSNLLARLRELTGDPLFARGPRGLQPTLKAQAMIDPVREVLGMIGRQFGHADEIDLASYRRTFHTQILDTLEALILPPLVRLIAARAPGITLEARRPGLNYAQDIIGGTVDLVCYAAPVVSPEISAVPICPVDLVLVARRDHPGLRRKLDVAMMGELPYVALTTEFRSNTLIDRELLVHGIKRRTVLAVGHIWSMLPLLEGTDLVTMLPRSFAAYVAPKFDLATYELPLRLGEQHLYMMWHVKMDGDPGHRWFRETLMAIAQERLGGEVDAAGAAAGAAAGGSSPAGGGKPSASPPRH